MPLRPIDLWETDIEVSNVVEMPAEVVKWRQAQRAELLARRQAVAPAERQRWTATITQLLTELFPLLQGRIVGFYWPFKSEFDPRFAIHGLRMGGATAALPEVERKGAPLKFREWWPGMKMTKGVFDLPVPDGSAVVVPQALLIPPVGFDLKGYRLGYGGGYFDRTLAGMQPQPLKIGLAFELSRIPSICPQPHDVPMDLIVTETGIHCARQSGLQCATDARGALEFARARLAAA